ncbi:MAG: hypothetical protein R3C68_09680 [Myxococcota bacterium]
MAQSPLIKRLRQRAKELSTIAVDEILSHDSNHLGSAVRGAQEGRRVLDQQGARILGVLGLATQEDCQRVGRKVGRLRKRMLELLDRLDEPDQQ